MSNFRCPLCGNSRLSPLTAVALPDRMGLCYVHDPDGGMFSRGKVVLTPSIGCACLDCGHVLYFLGPEDLDQLRREAGALHATAHGTRSL
jgi:hypothetical protein